MASYSLINAYCPHWIYLLIALFVFQNGCFNAILIYGNLNLSLNSLSKFSVNIRHMMLLSNLDLSNNQLEELDLEKRNALDQLATDTVIIRLIGNDLKCCRKTLEFLIWMRNSKKVHFTRMRNYTCSFENNVTVHLLILTK